MGASLEGLGDVEKAIKRKLDPDKIERGLKQACNLVERSAKMRAPKGTGELRRSIKSRIDQDGDELIGVVYTPLEYAPYVEYGTGLFAVEGGRQDVPWCYKDDKGEWHTTSGMKPHPFMMPALTHNRVKIIAILEEAMKE